VLRETADINDAALTDLLSKCAGSLEHFELVRVVSGPRNISFNNMVKLRSVIIEHCASLASVLFSLEPQAAARSKIVSLRLPHCKGLTQIRVSQLSALSGLKILDVSGTSVSEECIQAVVKAAGDGELCVLDTTGTTTVTRRIAISQFMRNVDFVTKPISFDAIWKASK
jgi:hypothetical protein